MMTTLKKLRLQVGKTQAEVAKLVGTSQPNYQRWENGTKVPKSKQKRLALMLKTTVGVLTGEDQIYEIENSKKDDYYGEIAIHFAGEGGALMFPISERGMESSYGQFSTGEEDYITIESLDNRIFCIRRSAIEDVHISSDGCDFYGPEHKSYKGYVGVYGTDDLYWEGLTYFNEEGNIDYESLEIGVDDPNITEEYLANIKLAAGENITTLVKYAKEIIWQFSSGKTRSEIIVYESQLLLDVIQDMELDHIGINIDIERYHRMIYINKENLDYISIPTSLYRSAWIEDLATKIDKK